MKKSAIIGTVRVHSIIAAAFLIVGLASAAQAAIAIYTPIGATASSELASSPPRTALQTINGSGLMFTVPTTINSIADLPNHNEVSDDMWLTDNDNPPTSGGTGSGHIGWIVFDLGPTPPTINALFVWNYAEQVTSLADDRFDVEGANAVTIYADNSAISPTITGINGTINNNGSINVESTTFAQETPGSAANPAAFKATPEEIDFGQSVTARYIELKITSNFSGTANFVGLSEDALAEIPEPGAGLLCLFGGVGMLTRRRKATQAA